MIAAPLRQTAALHYAAGMSVEAIAPMLGIGESSVRRAMAEHGVAPRPKRKLTAEQDADVVARYLAGESAVALGAEYGVAHQGVVKRLREAGHEPRDPWDTTHRQPAHTYVSEAGYRYVRLPADDPMASMAQARGYVFEHRLVMARALGTPLPADVTVHHVNGDRLDNRLENLQIRFGAHGSGHALECADCGSRLIRPTTI